MGTELLHMRPLSKSPQQPSTLVAILISTLYSRKQVSEMASDLSQVTEPVTWQSQDSNSGQLDSKARDLDLHCPAQHPLATCGS